MGSGHLSRGWKGMDGSCGAAPRGGAGDGAESPGWAGTQCCSPNPGELSLRRCHRDHPRSRPKHSSLIRDTGTVGSCLRMGEPAQMPPPAQRPRNPFINLGSAGRKGIFPNTCPLGPPPSPEPFRHTVPSHAARTSSQELGRASKQLVPSPGS